MVSPEVIVVGGGLAGIAAALELNKAHRRVLLLEKSGFLGGRAGSITSRDGEELDVGHHVYLGCCRAFRALLRELGAEDLAPLAKRLDLSLIDLGSGEGAVREAKLAAVRLPYPLSLAGAVLRYAHLAPSERLDVLRIVALAKSAYRNPKARPLLERASFSDWLRQKGARPRTVGRLWEPLVVATLNSSSDAVSAKAGVMVIAEGLAGGREAASVGVFRAPMGKLYDSVERLLSARGQVRLSSPVRELIIDGGEVKGVILADGTEIGSRSVIVAVSHVHLPALLPKRWADDPLFDRVTRLPTRPIVNVHLWYDRPVAAEMMTGVLDSPLQWLFDLSRLHGKASGPPGATHYCVSISDPGDLAMSPQSSIIDALDREVRRAFPGAKDARLMRGLVRKMRHATFLCAPGTDELRPDNETPVQGLFLAGDYTNTGWPATMESAVQSGRRAAAIALQRLAHV